MLARRWLVGVVVIGLLSGKSRHSGGAEPSAPPPGETLAKLKQWDAKVGRDRRTGEIVSLDLGETAVTDEDLAVLSHFPKLRGLKIDRTKVTDKGMAHLEKLTLLEVLDLEFTAVTDAGLAKLTGLKALKSVDLEGTKISAAGLAHLHGMLSLRSVDHGTRD